MDTISIFGHKKPDTDSVTAAIALSNLKNKLGMKTIPYVLGNINNETKFVLKYYGINEPKYLNDVKLQIKNITFDKDININELCSIFQGYKLMNEREITAIPIVNNDNKYLGAMFMKEIVHYLFDDEQLLLDTSYSNLIDVLEGKEILKFDEEISGDIVFASFKSTTFIENIKLDHNTILVVGDRHSIIEYAILCGIKLIIVTGGKEVRPEHIRMAEKNKVNIIQTNFLSYKTTRLLPLTNYIRNICNKNAITIKENDLLDEFIELAKRNKKSNYPVLNKHNECAGMLKLSNINNKNKKKVILVDHNEYEQSVDGLDEAEIIEIVDHHKIGSHNTSLPINFRNMTVGSTNTIIYKMYKENNIKIDGVIAGLMMAGIISDTLLFKSPTTTDDDIFAVKALSIIANVDYESFAKDMFDAGSSLDGKSVEEIIYGDFKNFNVDNKKIGVSQISTTNAKQIINNISEYIDTIEKIAKLNDYYVLALFVTDIIKEGSYVIFSNNSKDILQQSLKEDNISQGQYLEGIISRKKQIIPNIMDVIEHK